MLILNDTQTKSAAAQDRRAGRYAARHTLWSESDLPRVRSCGRAKQRNDVGVQLKVSTDAGGRHAGIGNVQHCGSAWACPVCSAVINSQRQGDISAALTAWHKGDGVTFGRVALVTLTMRHRMGQALSTLWDALSDSWNLVGSGRGWASDQLEHGELVESVIARGKYAGQTVFKGRIPVIRVVEVTQGVKGWHVHVHALLLLPASASDASVQALGASMWGRWLGGLEARGLDCDRAHGVDARLLKGDPSAALGEYFTKSVYSASMEVARSDMKSANRGNRTPFAILAAVVVDRGTGEVGENYVEDLATWHEYERASKGRRQITWSYGLRGRLLPDAPAVELTDQELADLDHGGDVVVELNADLWAVIVARRADWRLLAAFESSDADGYGLLWQLAAAAECEGAAEWARLLQESDPLRRVWQTKDPR